MTERDKTIAIICLGIIAIVLIVICNGCAQSILDYTEYNPITQEVTKEFHYGQTMVCSCIMRKNVSGGLDGIFWFNVGQTETKTDPNSIEALGGAIGETGKVLMAL